MIIGVKEYGYGVHLIPTIDTVRKGANLTIYTIDRVIDMWKSRHGYFPTVIYVQVSMKNIQNIMSLKHFNLFIVFLFSGRWRL
jgi:hypothetical protein